MSKERVTTKIYPESLPMLKVIAAYRKESMPATLERLIEAEYEQVRKELARESDTRLQDGVRSDT